MPVHIFTLIIMILWYICNNLQYFRILNYKLRNVNINLLSKNIKMFHEHYIQNYLVLSQINTSIRLVLYEFLGHDITQDDKPVLRQATKLINLTMNNLSG